MTDNVTTRLNRVDAAAYLTEKLGVSVTARTLAAWATSHKGPNHVRIGMRTRYEIRDLDAYAARAVTKRVFDHADTAA